MVQLFKDVNPKSRAPLGYTGSLPNLVLSHILLPVLKTLSIYGNPEKQDA